MPVDEGDGGTDADRAAVGLGDGTGTNGELGLVVRLDDDVACRDGRACGDLGGRRAPGDEHRERAGDRRRGACAGGGTRDALGAEKTREPSVHVLGEGRAHGNAAGVVDRRLPVAGTGGNLDGPRDSGDGRDGLVAVDADRDGCADGVGGTLRHGGTRGVGAVVGLVDDENVDGAGAQDPRHRGQGLVLGDVDGDGGRDHELLVGRRGVGRDAGLVGVVGDGLSAFVHLCLVPRLEVQGVDDVRGERRVVLGLVRLVVLGIVLGVAVVVQALVQLVRGVVVLVLVLVLVLDLGVAAAEAVDPGLHARDAVAELAEDACHVGTHGGRDAVGLVLVELVRADEARTLDGARARELGLRLADDDVERDRGADGGLVAHREAGCVGERGARGLGIDGDVVGRVLVARPRDHVVLEAAVALLDATRGRERAARGEGRLGLDVHDVDGDGRVHRDVLLNRGRVLERVGARDRVDRALVGRHGMLVEGGGRDDATGLDRRGRREVENVQGEGRADADGLAGVGVALGAGLFGAAILLDARLILGVRARDRLGASYVALVILYVLGRNLVRRPRAGVGLFLRVLVLLGSSRVGDRGRRHGVERVGGLGGDLGGSADGDGRWGRAVMLDDGRLHRSVDDGDGDAARDADVRGASACDGVGHGLVGGTLGSRREDRADEAENCVAKRGLRLRPGLARRCLDLRPTAGTKELAHRVEVEEVLAHLAHEVVDDLLEVGTELLVLEDLGDADLGGERVEECANDRRVDGGLLAVDEVGQLGPLGIDLLDECPIDEVRDTGEAGVGDGRILDLSDELREIGVENGHNVLLDTCDLDVVVDSGVDDEPAADGGGGVAEVGGRVVRDDVDRDGDAHADPRLGSRRVRGRRAIRVAEGDDGEVLGDHEAEAVAEPGENLVVLDVEGEPCGDGDATLAGLGLLPVGGLTVELVGSHVGLAGVTSEPLEGTHRLVGLFVSGARVV